MAMFMLRLSGLLALQNTTSRHGMDYIGRTADHPNDFHLNNRNSDATLKFYNMDVGAYNASYWSDTTTSDDSYNSTIVGTVPTSERTGSLQLSHQTPIASPLISSVQILSNDTSENINAQSEEIQSSTSSNLYENALTTPMEVFDRSSQLMRLEVDSTDATTPNTQSVSTRTNSSLSEQNSSEDYFTEDKSNEVSVSESTFPAVTTISGPIIEELLDEDIDDIMGIIRQDMISEEIKDSSSSSLISSNFDYYDFSAEKKSVHVPPPLTSHSLVSPVPYPGSYPRKRGDIQSSSNTVVHDSNNGGGSAQPDIANNDVQESYNERRVVIAPIPEKQRKTIKPVAVTSFATGRNNPYPYGPMFLPGYSETTITNSNNSVTNNVVSHYVPHLTTTSTNTVDPQHAGEEYEYEYEAYDYKENIRKVQTEKPPVLFHFDGPGYTPEAPSTTPPAVRAPTPSDPWDCAPRCPNYTLEDWNSFYDVRRYPAMIWLSTIILGKDRVLAELQGYMRLQDYFYGLNDRGQVLNLSVPFITQIKQGRHPGVLTELNDFTISLHISEGSVAEGYELPTPISNEVLINSLEAKTVFVNSFEVDVWDVTAGFLQQKVDAFMERLRSNGESFVDRYYYLASYSRPELYQPVYYEVWVYASSLRTHRVPPPEPLPRPQMPPLSKLTHDTMQRLCRGVECPSFEVVRSYKYGIQKRRYFDVVFASVSPGDCYFSTLAVWKGFMPLHLYKHGINNQMTVIEATRPIAVVRVKEDSTPHSECPQNLTMSLFLPRRLHAAPPLTGYTAPGPVVITALEDVMVYAYTLGGYLLDPTRVRKELSDLKYRLSEFGACYRDDIYYIVVYDFISRYHGRQNEIWIVAENCRATHNG